MSRASDFVSRFMGYLPTVKDPVFLDFGSVMTRLQVGNKVVFHQPTCINIHKQTGSVVAIGKRALHLWGKTPDTIETLFPVQYGVIADQEAAEKYIKALFRIVFKKEELFILRLNGAVSLNATASPVEKHVLKNVMNNVGMSGVKQISKSRAFYCTLRSTAPMGTAAGVSLCTIDVGGQTTEVGLFAGDQCIFSKTIPIGGISFTEKVKYGVRTHHQVAIGWATAKSIKQQIGEIFSDTKEPKKISNSKIAVRGKNVLDSTITTVTVSASDFADDFLELMQELVEEILISFSLAPTDVVAEALSNGVYITGGSSQLKGMKEYFQQVLKCDVIVARDPQLSVVQGLACLMK